MTRFIGKFVLVRMCCCRIREILPIKCKVFSHCLSLRNYVRTTQQPWPLISTPTPKQSRKPTLNFVLSKNSLKHMVTKTTNKQIRVTKSQQRTCNSMIVISIVKMTMRDSRMWSAVYKSSLNSRALRLSLINLW